MPSHNLAPNDGARTASRSESPERADTSLGAQPPLDTLAEHIAPTGPNDGLDAGDDDEHHLSDALVALPLSDWLRVWATRPVRSLPRRFAFEIQLSITEFALKTYMGMGAMGFVSTVLVSITLLGWQRQEAKIWIIAHMIDYAYIALSGAWLFRRLRSGKLTAATFNIVAFPAVVLCATCWGLLPLAVGTDSIVQFYFASCVSAMLSFFGFFWVAGHWPLSVMYSTIVTAGSVVSYATTDVPGEATVNSLFIPMYFCLYVLSALATIAMVNSRYETVVARQRKQLVRLLMQDYERGGHDWIWETDEQMRLTHVPPRMALAFGRNPHAHQGALLTDLIANDRMAVEAVQTTQPFQTVITDEDGLKGIEVRLKGRPTLVSGRCMGYRGVGSDEAAARRSVQADRTSERLDAMVTLTGGLAHDVNNLLATILGSVELATYHPNLDPEVKTHLDRAIDACLRTRVINRDVAAASGRDLSSEPAPFDAIEIVRQVVADASTLHPHARVVVEHDDAPAWTYADATHFMRVVRNLVDNACHAVGGPDAPSDAGVVTVKVAIERHRDRVPMTVVTFTDDGPGVPAEMRDRLFEPFVTTRRGEGGSGLGLAVARGFAQQSGGELTLEDTERGATFRLLIPIATRADIDTYAARPAMASIDVEIPNIVNIGGSVLVLEDDPNLADTMSQWLRNFGANARVVESVADAIKIVEAADFNAACVISDLVLLDGEGFDVIAALRRSHPEIPAIYVSGFTKTLPATVSDELRCPFVAKPFSSRELLEALVTAGVDIGAERPASGCGSTNRVPRNSAS